MRGEYASRNHLGSVGLLGVFLGLAGALLDFYSGFQILSQPVIPGGMGMLQNGYTLAWGVGILALGAVLLVTAAASATSSGMHQMKTFGAIMALYGILMLFVGVSMYSGASPMIAGTAFSGLGMLAVGGLMVVNGAVMSRPRAAMASAPMTGHAARNVSLAIAAIVIVAAGLVVAISLNHGSANGGMQSTSTTSTTDSSTGSVQVLASAASCSGSGSTEQCRMTLTNSGNAGAAITGAGTLYYNGAGGMGMNGVTTTTGCTVLTGSLGPGQSEQVSCTFTVAQSATSGTQISGTVALRDGTSVQFSGTA
jgi:hypothetical protein